MGYTAASAGGDQARPVTGDPPAQQADRDDRRRPHDGPGELVRGEPGAPQPGGHRQHHRPQRRVLGGRPRGPGGQRERVDEALALGQQVGRGVVEEVVADPADAFPQQEDVGNPDRQARDHDQDEWAREAFEPTAHAAPQRSISLRLARTDDFSPRGRGRRHPGRAGGPGLLLGRVLRSAAVVDGGGRLAAGAPGGHRRAPPAAGEHRRPLCPGRPGPADRLDRGLAGLGAAARAGRGRRAAAAAVPGRPAGRLRVPARRACAAGGRARRGRGHRDRHAVRPLGAAAAGPVRAHAQRQRRGPPGPAADLLERHGRADRDRPGAVHAPGRRRPPPGGGARGGGRRRPGAGARAVPDALAGRDRRGRGGPAGAGRALPHTTAAACGRADRGGGGRRGRRGAGAARGAHARGRRSRRGTPRAWPCWACWWSWPPPPRSCRPGSRPPPASWP